MMAIVVSGTCISLGLTILWRLQRALVNRTKLYEVPPALVPRGCCWRGPVKGSGSNPDPRTHRRRSSLPENYRLDGSDPT